MHYNMTTPCDQCPFLQGSNFSLVSLKRHAASEFACHKTCEIDDESGNFKPKAESPHCAGALIFLEKRDTPHQMMRIAERIGMYDRQKLNMAAPVQ